MNPKPALAILGVIAAGGVLGAFVEGPTRFGFLLLTLSGVASVSIIAVGVAAAGWRALVPGHKGAR